ncbi:MAG: hypothetical protein ABR593_05245 [Candidatus Limnocylindria bacterium]
MQVNGDALRREMRIERIEREDGRALLLFSWPDSSEEPAPAARADEPILQPWSPEAGPADV